MGRRKNELNDHELAVVQKSSKSYVDTFKDAIDLFIHDCELRNLLPHTIQYYLNEIHALLNQLKEHNIDARRLRPHDLTGEHFKTNVILFMKNYKGSRTVTINTRLRALRSFYNFLYKFKHIPNNPMENIKLLKDRKTVIATFSKDQLNSLFKQPDVRTFTGVRDYTIMNCKKPMSSRKLYISSFMRQKEMG